MTTKDEKKSLAQKLYEYMLLKEINKYIFILIQEYICTTLNGRKKQY